MTNASGSDEIEVLGLVFSDAIGPDCVQCTFGSDVNLKNHSKTPIGKFSENPLTRQFIRGIKYLSQYQTTTTDLLH